MILRLILYYLWSVWLGLALSVAGIQLSDWRYYFIAIPTAFLVTIRPEYPIIYSECPICSKRHDHNAPCP